MKKKQNLISAVFLAPYMLIFFIFRLGPSISGLLISLTNWNIISEVKFVGLANFKRMFETKHFWTSLFNTGKFVVIVVPCVVILSLALAVLFNQKLKFRGIARTITIIPYVLIPAVSGVIWNWMYSYKSGILNYYLDKIGVRQIGWLIDKNYALISVAIVIIWSFLGYNMILFLAGLQNISSELFEASKIDGANDLQTFAKITLPLLKPVTSLVVTLSFINTIQIYDQIYVMTNGGPGTATMTLVQYMYTSAFKDYDMGYGSAIGTTIVVILVVIYFLVNKVFQRGED